MTLKRYSALLDELFHRRSLGAMADDDEERFAEWLNDCRADMSAEEEQQISSLIAARRAAAIPRISTLTGVRVVATGKEWAFRVDLSGFRSVRLLPAQIALPIAP